MPKTPGENKDFDYILNHYVGGGGWWQWKRVLIISTSFVGLAVPVLMHVFTSLAPAHRCFVEGCDDPNQPTFQLTPGTNDFLSHAIPTSSGASTFLKDEVGFDPCQQYAHIDKGSCEANAFDTNNLEPCKRYVYDKSEMTTTLATELDLVCESEHKNRFLSSVIMLGFLTGSLLGGRISDRIGRTSAALLGLGIIVPSVALGGFVKSYIGYVILRYICCTAMVFGWIGTHVFVIEYFSSKHRNWPLCFSHTMGKFYEMLLVVTALATRTRAGVHVGIAFLATCALPLFYIHIPESCRWLVSNSRVNKAQEIVVDIARTNKRPIDDVKKSEIAAILKNTALEAAQTHAEKLNLYDMFRGNLKARTLILVFNWVCAIVLSYTIALNVKDLGGNVFANHTFSLLMSAVGILFSNLLIVKQGRKRTLVFASTGGGLTCLAMAFLPKDAGHSSLMMVLYFVGRVLSEAMAYTCWYYTAELYPTNLRSQAIGFCSSISRIFGLSSPWIPELARVWSSLPMLLISVPAIAAGILAKRLPETKDALLPETLEDAMMLDFRGSTSSKSEVSVKVGRYTKVSQNSDSEDEDFEMKPV